MAFVKSYYLKIFDPNDKIHNKTILTIDEVIQFIHLWRKKINNSTQNFYNNCHLLTHQKKHKIEIICIYCKQTFHLESKNLNRWLQCSHCNKIINFKAYST